MAEVVESLEKMSWMGWPRQWCQVEAMTVEARVQGVATSTEEDGDREANGI